MNRHWRILPIVAASFVLACGETPTDPPSEFGGPSLAKVVVEPGDDLQAVIDGAEPGTEIELEPGVYDLTGGGVVIDKRLTLDGDGDAVIQGPANGTAFTVNELAEGAVVTFRDLRIEGGDLGIVASGDVVVEDCEFVDLDDFFGIGIVAVSGSVTSIRNSSFKRVISGVLGIGEGTRIDLAESTFERMGVVGAQVQAGAIGHFHENTFSDCNVLGIPIFTCIGFRSASGEAVENTIDKTLTGIRAFLSDALIKENEVSGFGIAGIRAQNVVTVTGSENEIEDAAGGDIDCSNVLLPDFGPTVGTVQVIENEIENGDGVGLLVRAEQFDIVGGDDDDQNAACVGP